MSTETDRALAEEVMGGNRYLTLATSDGGAPWIAPVEYLRDEAGNFYFFSTEASRHAQHIERNAAVAVAIFGPAQPEYPPRRPPR